VGAADSSKTHPHIDDPSETQLRRVVAGKPPAVRRVYLEAHRLVAATLPDVSCSVDRVDGQIGYGARQYGYDGWGMAALAPHAKWVSLGFIKGTSLHDPEGLLEGTGATVRHVKLRTLEELGDRKAAIARMLREASRLLR
jgi:hypothetical protein